MNRTLNTATLVAIFSLAILVMASCGNNTAPAPAEKVVNLDELPTLYSAGTDTTVTACTTTDFRWMDCEGSFHPGTKFVPEQGTPITLQGEKADLSKIIGLSDGERLVIKSDSTSPAPAPLPVVKPDPKPAPAPPPVKEDEATTSGWSNIPWHWLGWLILAGAALAVLYILLGLLRRLAHWMNTPLVRRQELASHGRSDAHHRPHADHGTADVNTRGGVVIGRAGDTIERTTTVTERFVVRDRGNDRGGNRYRDRRDN